MSLSTFERKVGVVLREDIPNAWVYHPQDFPKARHWAPADFLCCVIGRLVAVECKEIDGTTLPLSRWTEPQRQTAREVISAGGEYRLMVQFAGGAVYSYDARPLLGLADRGRASIKPGEYQGVLMRARTNGPWTISLAVLGLR